MHLKRRRNFLSAAAAIGAAALLPRRARAAGGRVVIVGGGWGGLAAARCLRTTAPELEVTLLERKAAFWSCPLSNKWLVGQVDGKLLTRDTAAAAQAFGYRYVQAEASRIDRDARRILTDAGGFDYDWLVLAVGIRHDYTAWFGTDRESAELARRLYPAAWTPGEEFTALRGKLAGFKGGNLLLTIPPAPFRCPPAPFERALLIAGWLEARGIPGRVVIVDPNPPFQEFQRIFRERYPQRIAYHAQMPILGVDLGRRIIKSEFDDHPFDDAILMPPQQAGDLAWQAGLIGSAADGRPTGWAAADPLTLVSRADPRIYLVGDMLDRVSGLFGHYPKTAQIAVRQGCIVARRIAAQARGGTAPPELPDSLCHIATAFDPPAAIRIAASYRRRGDGELVQQQNTERDAQPRGEDIVWLRAMYRETFGAD